MNDTKLIKYTRLQNIANEYWNMQVHAYYKMSKSKEMYVDLKYTTTTDISWIEDNVKKYKALSDAYFNKCTSIRAIDIY